MNNPYLQNQMGINFNPDNVKQVVTQNPTFVDPNFTPIPTMPEQIPNFVNPYFQGVIPTQTTPQEYYNLQVPIYKQEEIVANQANFNPNIYVPDYIPQPVGLPMDNLIIPNTDNVAPNYVDNVSFKGLVTEPDPRYNEENFSVYSIPPGLDRSMLPMAGNITDLIGSELNNSHNNKNSSSNEFSKKYKVTNWFTRLLDQRGEDYISSGKLTVDEVSRNAEKILDDMISGRVNYDTQAQYIINPVVIETLINYCSNKLAINKAIQFALGYLYTDYVNRGLIEDPQRLNELAQINDALSRNITHAISIVNQDVDIYTILYNKLVYANDTKNISALFSLSNDLNNYKKQMKKRY